jgi:hypothetical protein
MSVAAADTAQAFVRRWQVAGPALDAVKWAELRNMGEEEGRRQSALVMEMSSRWLEQNPGVTRPSGMVAQQKVFARWWTNRA